MRTLRPLRAVLAAFPLLADAACGGAASPPVAPVAHAPDARGCGRVLDASRAPVPVELTRTGSSVALARLGGKTYAYIADEDDSAVHVVDVDAKKDVSRTPVAGKPAQLMFLADGRLVVTLRDQAQVAVLEPGPDPTKPMDPRCSVGTEAEPYGVAVTPDDSAIVVTSAWGKSLASYDAKSPTLARQWEVALPREPRGIVVSDDGARAFVAQAVGGQLSVVDLKLRQVIPTATHLTDENLKAASKAGTLSDTVSNLRFNAFGGNGKGFELPGLRAGQDRQPGRPRAHPAGAGRSRRSRRERERLRQLAPGPGRGGGHRGDRRGQRGALHGVAADHAGEPRPLDAGLLVGTRSPGVPAAALGRLRRKAQGAARGLLRHRRRRLLRRARGQPGARRAAPLGRGGGTDRHRRRLGQGPRGGVVPVRAHRQRDPPRRPRPRRRQGRRTSRPPVVHFALSEPTHALAVNLALGRVLFNMVGDERISHDGRACASCHPDGRDDSLTWATPNGPRRSIMLAGRVQDTAPFSWSGTEQTLKEHMGITFTRLKGSGDLRSMELDALADYVQTLAPPPVPRERPTSRPRSRAGSEIFHSAGGRLLDLPRRAPTPPTTSGTTCRARPASDKNGSFNTPSLRFVGGGGPYFHDGRYKTLHQLLTDADRKMGHTAQLSNDDSEALEAYLRSI